MAQGRAGRSVRAWCAIGAALWVGAITCLPREARAADPPAASDQSDVSKQAQQLFAAGQAAARAHQWEKARTFLLSAWRIHQHYRIAANLGRVELKLGRMREAAEHLTFFLRAAPKIEPEDRKQVDAMLAQARAKIGVVMVAVSPPEAEIRVDGEVVAKAGAVFVDPGTRRVEARAEGYVPAEKQVSVSAGHEARVELTLSPVPKPVEVVREKDRSGVVAGGAGGSGAKAGPNKVVVIAGGAAAGAALVVGIGMMAGSFVKAAEREKGCPDVGTDGVHHCNPEGYQAHLDRATFANVSFNSFIAAGALGAATLTYWLVTRKPAEHGGVKAAVLPGPGGAAAVLSVPW